MTNTDIINELASWGHQLRPEHIENFTRYLRTMLRRNRVIMIESEHGLEAIIFFFLINKPQDFTNRATWTTPEDTDSGHIFFIDKMLCRNWTRDIRESIRSQVESKFPQIEYALWLRRPNNRHVILKRGRILHGIQG